MSNTQLDYEFTGLFRGTSRKNFPDISEQGEGVLINADGLQYDDGVARFSILVSYQFIRAYAESFRNIDWALLLTVEDVASGRGMAVNLRDPHKRYADSNPNYRPITHNSGVLGSTRTTISYIASYIEVPLSVRVARPRFAPSLFISVTLHHFQSNRLGVDLMNLKTINYVAGKATDLAVLQPE